MADEQTQQTAPRRPRRWLWVLASLAVLVGGYACYRGVLSYKVNARQAELREAGVLYTPASLIDVYGPRSASDDNAANVYMQAFAAYVNVPAAVEEHLPPMSSKVKYPDPGQPYPAEMLAAMQTCLDLNQQSRQLMREASALQYARYPVEGLTDGSLQTHFLKDSVGARQLLLYEARLRIEAGDVSGATDAFVDLFALIRSLDSVPDTLTQSVRTMYANDAVNGCIDALSRTTFDEHSLERLRRAVASIDQTTGSARMGYRASATVYDAAYDEPLDDMSLKWLDVSRSQMVAYRWLGLESFDHLEFLALATRADNLFDLPEHSMLSEAQKLHTDVMALPDRYLIARSGSDGTLSLIDLKLRELSRMRALTCVVAIERFRVAEGRLPAKLDDLTPNYLTSIPVDPYDGKPMKYRTTDAGYLVYSIGRNVVDDGGDSSAVGTTGIALDEVVAITR